MRSKPPTRLGAQMLGCMHPLTLRDVSRHVFRKLKGLSRQPNRSLVPPLSVASSIWTAWLRGRNATHMQPGVTELPLKGDSYGLGLERLVLKAIQKQYDVHSTRINLPQNWSQTHGLNITKLRKVSRRSPLYLSTHSTSH